MAENAEGRDALATAIETFESRKSELLEKAEGRWVLIHDTDVVGFYDDYWSAVNAGYKAYPGKPTLVRQVLKPLTARPDWIGPGRFWPTL